MLGDLLQHRENKLKVDKAINSDPAQGLSSVFQSLARACNARGSHTDSEMRRSALEVSSFSTSFWFVFCLPRGHLALHLLRVVMLNYLPTVFQKMASPE